MASKILSRHRGASSDCSKITLIVSGPAIIVELVGRSVSQSVSLFAITSLAHHFGKFSERNRKRVQAQYFLCVNEIQN